MRPLRKNILELPGGIEKRQVQSGLETRKKLTLHCCSHPITDNLSLPPKLGISIHIGSQFGGRRSYPQDMHLKGLL